MEKIGVESVFGTDAFSKGLTTYLKGLDKANVSTSGFTGGVNKAFTVMGNIAKTAFSVLATSIGAGVAALGTIAVTSLNAGKDFESAFAGIEKTVDGLDDTIANSNQTWREFLEQGVRGLAKEIPITVEELSAIGEIGGQLGIGKESLIDFTETIANLGVATNLTEEQAATGLARIANIYNVSAEDMSDTVNRMGSAIVDLGNNFATTEPEILSFTERIAGAGKIAGLSEADLFGISTAFTSVGVEAEAGGTAVQKVLIAMNEAVAGGGWELTKFANASGLTAKEFSDAWASDPVLAFEAFVENLGNEGDNATSILENLGLTDQRLTRAFLSVAGAGDLLSESVSSSNAAFEENTALSEEAEKRYKTFESQMQIFKNVLNDIGIEIGTFLIPFATELLEAFRPFLDEFLEKLPGILETIQPIIENVISTLTGLLSGDISFEDLIPKDIKKGFENVLETIKGVLDDIGIDEIFGNMKGGFEDLKAFWDENGADITTQMKENFSKAGNTIKEIASKVLPALSRAFKTVTNFIKENGPKIVEVWTSISDVAGGIGDAIAGALDWIIPLFEGILETALLIWETVLNVFTGDFPAALSSLSEVFSTAWETIKETFNNFVAWVLSWFGMTRESFTEMWTGIFENMLLIVQNIIPFITYYITTAFENLKLFIAEVWENIKNTIIAVWESIKSTVYEAALNIWTSVLEFFTNIYDTISEKLLSAWETVANTWDLIKLVFTTIMTAIFEKVKEVFMDIKNKIKDYMELSKEIIKLVLESIRDKFQEIFDNLKVIVIDTLTTVKNFISDKLNAIKELFDNVAVAIQGVINKFQALVDAAKQKVTFNIVAPGSGGSTQTNTGSSGGGGQGGTDELGEGAFGSSGLDMTIPENVHGDKFPIFGKGGERAILLTKAQQKAGFTVAGNPIGSPGGQVINEYNFNYNVDANYNNSQSESSIVRDLRILTQLSRI